MAMDVGCRWVQVSTRPAATRAVAATATRSARAASPTAARCRQLGVGLKAVQLRRALDRLLAPSLALPLTSTLNVHRER